VKYKTVSEETFIVTVYDSKDIDTILGAIPTDIISICIVQTTIPINNDVIKDMDVDKITIKGIHRLLEYRLDLSRFIKCITIHLGILCPVKDIILPEGSLTIVIFINMNLSNPNLPYIYFPSTLEYIHLENTIFVDPTRFRKHKDYCSLIVALHSSKIHGGNIDAKNPPDGVHLLNTLTMNTGYDEYASWDILANPVEINSFCGWIGWWGYEPIELKGKDIPEGIKCVSNMSIYSEKILGELINYECKIEGIIGKL
jgi:hypothetical protein